ncbi:hypothetical protein [Peptacetobacter hiranonis]|uniref:Uncharacterized protein n=1 Tax=Peptacetobacter hiranonis (strain DSM 13275 / JCM 10541 / KCTC 15199 / TO-931) TaxID=500633 RepID=B6FXH8_PEPHT|nr:hypothetical protein [Peptacetobacter hiranonis]EEA85763.1 hypothetical protein CLOHIR_00577 [Peptacetobacter hiranonis DSM 13275]QEK20615.1 hypothetical protein KGNDJEFE_01098 [Peptacetobacter hiranonis]
MKITKRRKMILSSVLVAMVAITAGFEISSSQVMKPISQTGDIKEMEDISLVSQKNITGRTRFAIFGKDGKKIEYGKHFLTRNFLSSDIGLKEYMDLTKKNIFDTYDLAVGDKIYFLSQRIEDEKSSLVAKIYDKKSGSTVDKKIPIKEKDTQTISHLTNFIEKDGKFYALVSSDQELVSVVSLDFDKESYKILNTFKETADLSPNLFVQSWNSNDKYIYILMRNISAQEGDIVSNSLLRYDFKSNKFLKPLPLRGIEINDGFEYIDTMFLYENTNDKFIIYTGNAKDKHLYKITYDLETLKLEKKEKLNLEIDSIMAQRRYNNRFVGSTADDSRMMLLDGKIYYISAVKTNLLRNADSTGGNEVNISGMNTSVLKIFDIEKNKVVYEADFDSLDIESPIFIKGNK